jgi:two-component system OmpR family response regulator
VKKHIVVVDDDTVFGEILCAGLHKNAFTTKRFDTVDALLKNLGSISANPVDLFIIDFHLDKPNINGLDLCRRIKSKGAYPVIMLTGEDDVETTVASLYAGAEQYVTKPYELDELVARIHVVLKGWARAAVSYLESSGGAEKLMLTLQGRSRVLSCADKETKLTQREMSLAESLLGSMGIEMEREHIYFAIFGRAMEPFSRAVDILVARLRKKLKLVTNDYVIIPTRNSGYMLVKK